MNAEIRALEKRLRKRFSWKIDAGLQGVSNRMKLFIRARRFAGRSVFRGLPERFSGSAVSTKRGNTKY